MARRRLAFGRAFFFWADVHEKGEKREHVLREEWLVFIRLLMSWCLTMGRGRGSFL